MTLLSSSRIFNSLFVYGLLYRIGYIYKRSQQTLSYSHFKTFLQRFYLILPTRFVTGTMFRPYKNTFNCLFSSVTKWIRV